MSIGKRMGSGKKIANPEGLDWMKLVSISENTTTYHFVCLEAKTEILVRTLFKGMRTYFGLSRQDHGDLEKNIVST
jgi:hypothetical protein